MQSPAFQRYFEMSEKWLRPYAVFKVLQSLFGTAEHWHWGALSRPTPRVSARARHCWYNHPHNHRPCGGTVNVN